MVPQLLTNSRPVGCIGGDWNCIVGNATAHPESKMSNSLKRVLKTFELKDSFRQLYPKSESFSRYYGDTRGQGASRIDRQYHWGPLTIKEAKYLPLSFSDHHGLVIVISLPDPLTRIICPKGRPSFRIKEEVILDKVFQQNLSEAMIGWQRINSFGLETIPWWELIVKPGVRKLAMLRGRELNKISKESLTLLLVRQSYLNKKVKSGNFHALGELKAVHLQIQLWYQKSCEKIKDQSRATEFQTNEKVTIYHHEVHKKLIKKSSILKLDTPNGLIEGHDKCAEYLENEVKSLLLVDAGLSLKAQEKLLLYRS